MSRFIVNKGTDNQYMFTIKEDGTTLPLTLVSGDSFEALVYLEETDALVATITEIDSSNGIVVKEDLANGKISLLLKSAFTSTMTKERGNKEDRYYEKPTYRIVITCDTQNQGKFNIRIPDVYVG